MLHLRACIRYADGEKYRAFKSNIFATKECNSIKCVGYHSLEPTHVRCLVCKKPLVADLGNIQSHACSKPHLQKGKITKPSPEQLQVPDKFKSPTERRIAKATIEIVGIGAVKA